MHDALHSDNLLGNYRASGLLYSFLVEFNLCISHRESGSTYHPALIKAIDYINNHYQSSITMEELCSHCGVSKQHLCLLFRTMLHTRPMEYAAKRRIQVAKELLTGTSMTIEQIAAETGFVPQAISVKCSSAMKELPPYNLNVILFQRFSRCHILLQLYQIAIGYDSKII